VEAYDPATDQWQKRKSMPIGIHAMQTAVLNGQIYIVGGVRYDDKVYGDAIDSVERYDPATDTWTYLKPMGTAQGGLLVTLGGQFYILGGGNPDGDSIAWEAMEAYDPASNTWVKKASMLSSIEVEKAETINNKIYIMGGMRSINGAYGDLDSNSMEMYDFQKDQ
jgi:N-acetylneuraminic acid mutarotase